MRGHRFSPVILKVKRLTKLFSITAEEETCFGGLVGSG